MLYLAKKKIMSAIGAQIIDYVSTTAFTGPVNNTFTSATNDWFVVFSTSTGGAPTCSLNTVAQTHVSHVVDTLGYTHRVFVFQCLTASATIVGSDTVSGTTVVYRLRNITSISLLTGLTTYSATATTTIPSSTGSNVEMAIMRDRDPGATFSSDASRTLSQSHATYFRTVAFEQRPVAGSYPAINVSNIINSYPGVFAKLEIVSTMTAVIEPDPYAGLVTSLLHMDGDHNGVIFTDEKGLSWTRYSANTNDSSNVFGSASAYFNGSAYISNTTAAAMAFAANDFTIEAWINPSNAIANRPVFSTKQAGTPASYVTMQVNSTSAALAVYTGLATLVGGTVPFNVWSHVAVVRQGGTLTLFLNGVQVAQAAITGSIVAATGMQWGARGAIGSNPAEGFLGYIDEARITIGAARYTANFTPSKLPFSIAV